MVNSVNKSGLLRGIKVVEFGQFVAGPHTALLLSSLGAEVIKVERPHTGDGGRGIGFLDKSGLSGFFTQQNCGKKSISVDLKHPEGLKAVSSLCVKSDIIVENFRPGSMERIGLDYEKLSKIHPGLIMCSISAYGQSGPYSNRPGFGPLVEALGGVTELTGEPNSGPVQTRYMIADNIAADKAVGAICASLFDRTRTGKGQYIDISLLDCIVEGDEATLQHYLWSNGEIKLTRRGKTDDTVVPFGIFQVTDRHIAIHCATNENWAKLCKATQRNDWLLDERFSSLENRRINRDVVYRSINEWFSKKTDAFETVKYLQQNGVPCELAKRVDEVAKDPQIIARNMFVEKEIPGVGKRKIVNVAYKIKPSKASISGSPPSLGEHTELILSDLGYSKKRIKELYSDGVVFSY
tara:strand:+ start:500 stop:1723 length:1224 start_codon:yes stop_codon:yes gene_type:complete